LPKVDTLEGSKSVRGGIGKTRKVNTAWEKKEKES